MSSLRVKLANHCDMSMESILVMYFYFSAKKRQLRDAYSVGIRDDMLLLPKLGQLFCLRTRL